MKTCTKCKETKPLASFSKDKAKPDGLQYYCKPCDRRRNRAYQAANRERINIRHRAWHAANRERHNAKTRERHAANRDQINAQVREYQAANPHKKAAHKAVARAIERGDLVRTPCEECGEVKTHAHHDSYLKADRLNVRFLCQSCHQRWHAVNGEVV